MLLLKVSPSKGVILFWKWGKFVPRFIGIFRMVARVGKVAYRLDLPEDLSQIHSLFMSLGYRSIYWTIQQCFP